jgi:hypothetical protein
MFDGHHRWTWLKAFAVGNLVLWVGIACAVGLCAGDGVDLGVETLARHVQATAVTSWGEATSRGLASAPPSRPQQQDGESSVLPAVAMAGSTLEEDPGTAVPPAATVSPPAEAAALAAADDTAPAPAPSSPAGGGVEPGVEPSEPTPPGDAGPGVTTTPVSGEPAVAADIRLSSPLLLVDPEFQNLGTLSAEMERSAPGRPVQIDYQEEALNREIATLWRTNPDLPYRNVQVDLQDNGVAIRGQVTVLGFQVDAYLEGTVVARDCRPALQVERVSLAGVLAPRFVRERVAAMAQESMAWYPADYPLCLEQIVLEETRATCHGYRR